MTPHFSSPVAPIRFVVYALLLAFATIIGRLAYLQIQTAYTLFRRGKQNYLRYEQVASPRGNIYDCTGKLLATNKPIIQLVWQGTGHSTLTATQRTTLAKVQQILSLPLNESAITQVERRKTALILQNDLSFEQLSCIMEQFPNDPNLTFKTDFIRYYPHGTVACHILGYLSAATTQLAGVMGLEKACDTLLRGVPGQVLHTINAFGSVLSQQEVYQARAGNSVQTTLNVDLHMIAEACFPEGYAGAVVIMEASTGALRVVLSQPMFDPNMFLTGVNAHTWQQLLDRKAFLNRVFSACYPPASLFKLVTMVMALDTHLIEPDEVWFCPGYILFCGRLYHCMNQTAHGHITVKQAIAKSCNIPFFELGKRIKINTLAQYAHWLCLGSTTNSIIGEKIGLIPTTHWKQATMKEPWWPGETLSVAIGQGALQVTPLQICRAIGTICQGYSVTPHLLQNTPVERTIPPINPAVFTIIKDAMKHVVTTGTGKKLANLANMHVYAKTGTAQTRALSSVIEGDATSQAHGWFAAHVTYKDQPSFVIVILIEHSGTSRIPTTVAKEFLTQYQQYIDLKEHTA